MTEGLPFPVPALEPFGVGLCDRCGSPLDPRMPTWCPSCRTGTRPPSLWPAQHSRRRHNPPYRHPKRSYLP